MEIFSLCMKIPNKGNLLKFNAACIYNYEKTVSITMKKLKELCSLCFLAIAIQKFDLLGVHSKKKKKKGIKQMHV